jgi:hypothetical protein
VRVKLDVEMTSTPHSTSVDTVVAFAAGPLPWSAGTSRASRSHAAPMGLAVMALLGLGLTVASVAMWNPADLSSPKAALAASCCVASLLVPALTLRKLAPQSESRLPTSGHVAFRIATLALFVLGWLSVAPGAVTGLAWPLGVYIGAEGRITTILIGAERRAREILRQLVLSASHFGLLAAIGVFWAYSDSNHSSVIALQLAYLAELVVAVGAVTYSILAGVDKAALLSQSLLQRNVEVNERRRRAHWIHDDVCADLRSVRIKLATREMTRSEMMSELDELDFRMRVRQLDEIVEGGTITAAEVIQPYLRRAQNAGIQLIEVPRHEAASISVGVQAAEVLRRSISGLISNAEAMGARKLSIRFTSSTSTLTLDVEDDAGGFDLSDAPAGRGLASLAADPLVRELNVSPGLEGAVVTVIMSAERERPT